MEITVTTDDMEGNFNRNQLAFIEQLINSFAYNYSYDVTLSLQHYDTFSRFIIDGASLERQDMLEIKGAKATMVALYEKFSDTFGSFN